MSTDVQETTSKPWYTSKTLWFNIATVGGAVAAGAVGILPIFEPVVTAQVYAVATMMIGLVNIALRSITTDAIWFKS